ncbi:hypothetical protein D3C85_981800 [compost metagenome]
MVQGNRQFRLRLTLKRALQQVVALLVMSLFVRCTRRTEVVQQRLPLGLRSPMQMTLRAGPATFGQVQLTMFDRHLNPATAITPRPGIDHTSGGRHQFDQRLDAPEHQPENRQQRQGCPQARFEAEALVGDQHVTGMLGDRQTQRSGSGDDQEHDHIEALHGVASWVAGLASGLIESSALTLRRSR